MFGQFSEESLSSYASLVEEKVGPSFSEFEEDEYDFTRCMRPDGSFYGTRGKCRKGSEAGPADRAGTGEKGAREAAAQAKKRGVKGGGLRTARAEGRKAALASSRAEAGKKISEKNARTRLFIEELKGVKDNLKGASSEERQRIMIEAGKRADERVAKGETGKKRDHKSEAETK